MKLLRAARRPPRLANMCGRRTSARDCSIGMVALVLAHLQDHYKARYKKSELPKLIGDVKSGLVHKPLPTNLRYVMRDIAYLHFMNILARLASRAATFTFLQRRVSLEIDAALTRKGRRCPQGGSGSCRTN